jgi:sec-independent protein translocase protein TatA
MRRFKISQHGWRSPRRQRRRGILHVIVAFFVFSYIAFDVLDLDLSSFPLQHPAHKQALIIAEAVTPTEFSYLPDHDSLWTESTGHDHTNWVSARGWRLGCATRRLNWRKYERYAALVQIGNLHHRGRNGALRRMGIYPFNALETGCDRVAGPPASPVQEEYMFEGLLQPMHLLLIFLIALIVFGPKKLPELGKGLGEAIRGFKKAMEEESPDSARLPSGAAKDEQVKTSHQDSER